MATVNTIEETFSSMTPEQKKANLATVSYIKTLASMTNTNIARWDVLKMFSASEGDANLLSDKKAVNKIFFAKLEKLAEKKNLDVADIDALMPELTTHLEENFAAVRESHKGAIQEQIRTYMHDARRTHEQLVNHLKLMHEASKQLHMFSRGGDDPLTEVKKEIQETLKGGYWVNPIIHDGKLYLNTPANIVLTHKNRAAGIDTELDIGQVAVEINLKDLYMRVIPYKNNVNYDGLFHPHVSTQGDICWGNALDAMQTNTTAFHIGKNLELLYTLMTSYNDAAPYIGLASLRDHQKRYTRIPVGMKHPDKIKDACEPGEPSPLYSDDEAPHVGDRVRFEMGPGTSPRWDYLRDQGSSGRFVDGEVTRIERSYVIMSFVNQYNERREWSWPLRGDEQHSPDQWSRPGFLQRAQ